MESTFQMIAIKFISELDKNHFIKLNILIELFNSYSLVNKAGRNN